MKKELKKLKQFFIVTALYSLLLFSQDYTEYTFTYPVGNEKEVYIEGDFTGWTKIPMEKKGKIWSKTFKLQKNRLYEYRFVVDDKIELDPNNKVKLEVNNTSLIYLDSQASLERMGKKEGENNNLILLLLKEMLANQKKFLDELSLVRSEIVKKDLEINLLRAQIEKINLQEKEKVEYCKIYESQSKELSIQLDSLKKELQNSQEDLKKCKTTAKIASENYSRSIKTNAQLKKQLLELKKRNSKLSLAIRKIKKENNLLAKNPKLTASANNSAQPPQKEKQLDNRPIYKKVGKIYGVSNTSDLAIIYMENNKDVSVSDKLYVLKDDKIIATLVVTMVEKNWCYAKISSGDKESIDKQIVYVLSNENSSKNEGKE
jgi:hypothetical protein